MELDEQGSKLESSSGDAEYRAIEARVAAAERAVEALEIRKFGQKPNAEAKSTSLENRIDENHSQIMDTLRRLESQTKNEILERLAKVESKLQHVA
jgi:hypothetical protein